MTSNKLGFFGNPMDLDVDEIKDFQKKIE